MSLTIIGMSQVTIISGSSGAGKTGKLLDIYRAALDRARSQQRPGTTLWLTPNRRIQRAISQQVAARSPAGCFAPNILTFDLFAQKILDAAGRLASLISPVMKRLLLRRIAGTLQEQGELRYFKPIAGTAGFLDVISSFISELKREEIWPETFVEVCQQRRSAFARRDLEIGLIYARYQQHLTEQNWFDHEGRFWLARTALSEGIRGPFEGVETLVVDGFADFTQTQYEILGYLASGIEKIWISLSLEQPLIRPELFSKPQIAIARIQAQLPASAVFAVEQLAAEPPAAITNTPAISTSAPQVGLSKSAAASTAAEVAGPPVVDADDINANLKGATGADPSPAAATTDPITSPDRAPAVRVIAERLFSNPRFLQPSADASGLEVIATTGAFGEWEAVAHRIKRMLSGGVTPGSAHASHAKIPTAIAPQEIVIGLRTMGDEGLRLSAYLKSAGLPVWCDAALPFTSSPIVRALMQLMQLELEDWPFERLLAVLDSNFFQPAWPEWQQGKGVRAAAAALRHLRLNSDRELLLRVLARHAAEIDSPSEGRRDSLAETAQLAAPLLLRLSRSLERLRRPQTLVAWANILSSLGEDLGWAKQTTGQHPELAARDAEDLALLQRIVRTAAEADQKLAGAGQPQKWTLAEFTAELRDLFSHESFRAEPEPSGCIRILGIDQIRNLDVPHLFLMGLTENSFPSGRSDDCLFSEAERCDLISRGVALSHRSGHHADEMFLFYSVVTRARRSLTLSYPAVNPKGQPVFPSPYVTAVTSLFTREGLVITHEGKLSPVPATDRALTATDLRLAAMIEARQGRPELFRAVFELEPHRRTAWNTLAACQVTHHRFHERGFTPYEGLLTLPQNLDGLRQRFGAQHQFSATELESYARCPFQFWLSTVLRIGTVESPEEETDHAGRGILLHEVLASLLKEGVISDTEGLRTRFGELVQAQLNRQVPETELQRALVRIESIVLDQWGEAFVNQQEKYHLEYASVLRRTHSLDPEIPFGKLPGSVMVSEDYQPSIQFGRDETAVNLRGRIDRVDVGEFQGHPAYVVIDYKTGRPPVVKHAELITGRSIQLVIYLLAIKRLGLAGPNAVPFQMGFWGLKEKGFAIGTGGKTFEALDAPYVQALETILDEVLPRLAEGIRSGRFVVENEDAHCTGRCVYRTVCRVNQLRPLADQLGKKSPPPIDPTLAIGADGP